MRLPEFQQPHSSAAHVDEHQDQCAGCTGRRAFLLDAAGATMALAGLSMLSAVRGIEALSPRSGHGSVRYPLPTTDGVSIDKKNDIILCRTAGAVIAFSLACPHQSTTLRALPGTAGFQCPRHKSRYQPDGTFISGRATRNMDRLPITRDGDAIVVDPDVAYRSDKDAVKWASAVVRL